MRCQSAAVLDTYILYRKADFGTSIVVTRHKADFGTSIVVARHKEPANIVVLIALSVICCNAGGQLLIPLHCT